MLRRKGNQARYELEIKGITNETCFTDLARRDEKTKKSAPFDAMDPDWEKAFLAIENEGESPPEPEPELPRLSSEAWENLTPQQRQAAELFMEDISGREAARRMGISQPYFHEIIHGKDAQGGVIMKLRKYFAAKHPIKPL
jgi:DNA-directed RNA polymerase specialized sigma24 family protein